VGLQIFYSGRYVDNSHETAQDGFVGILGHPNDGFRRCKRVCHGLGGENHQRPVHIRVVNHCLQGVLVTIIGRMPDDIHRVVNVGGCREMLGQGLDRFRAKPGQFEPGRHGHIGGHDARTPGIGNDRHTASGGDFPVGFAHRALGLIGKSAGKIEQLVYGVYPDHTRLFENRIVYRFGTCKSAGMRGRCLGAGGGPPGFDDQNRCSPIAGSNFFDRLNKLRTPPQFFQIDHDDLGIRILVKIFQEVEFVHVGLVSNGYKLGKSKIPIRGKIEDRRAERTALGDKGYFPRRRHPGREAGVEPYSGQRIDYPETVGTNHTYLMLPAHGNNLLLYGGALFSHLSEACRDNDQPPDTFFNGLLGRCHGKFRRQDQHGQINAVRYVQNRWIGTNTQNRLGTRIHRVQDPRITASEYVGENIVPHFSGRCGGTDHGDRFRCKNRFQISHQFASPTPAICRSVDSFSF